MSAQGNRHAGNRDEQEPTAAGSILSGLITAPLTIFLSPSYNTSPLPPPPALDSGSGRGLPSSLVYVHKGRLWRWRPGVHSPEEISGRTWGSPSSIAIVDDSAETFFFAAHRREQVGNRTGININVANIHMQSPNGLYAVTMNWDVATAPDISRDHRTLIFVSNHHAHLRLQTNSTEIYIMRRPSLLPKRLTMDGGFKFNPRIAPDGHRVAYTWIRNDTSGIYVYDMRTRRATRVGPAGDYPTWTPDGEALTFSLNGRLFEVTVPAIPGRAAEARRLDVGVIRHDETGKRYISYPRWTDFGLLFTWATSDLQGVSLWDPQSHQERVLVSGPGEFGAADLADRGSDESQILPIAPWMRSNYPRRTGDTESVAIPSM